MDVLERAGRGGGVRPGAATAQRLGTRDRGVGPRLGHPARGTVGGRGGVSSPQRGEVGRGAPGAGQGGPSDRPARTARRRRCGAGWFVVLLCFAAACAPEPRELSPEQAALFAQPVDAELVVPAKRNALAYAVTRVEAPAGATVRLVMDNTASTASAMIHNVVVVADSTAAERVGLAAAGVRDNVPDDDAILAFTPLARPGERTAVAFTMPPPGEYPFLCTYPGHFRLMRGVLVSTPP